MLNSRHFRTLVFSALTIAVFAPSVAFASWWNPLSWSWTSLFSTRGAVPQQVVPHQPVTVSTVATSTPVAKIPVSNTIQSPTVKLTPLTNAQIIKKVKPAIVYIETKDGEGSGMIIQSSGTISYILTNAHVVAGVSEATITLQDSSSYTGTVIG